MTDSCIQHKCSAQEMEIPEAAHSASPSSSPEIAALPVHAGRRESNLSIGRNRSCGGLLEAMRIDHLEQSQRSSSGPPETELKDNWAQYAAARRVSCSSSGCLLDMRRQSLREGGGELDVKVDLIMRQKAPEEDDVEAGSGSEAGESIPPESNQQEDEAVRENAHRTLFTYKLPNTSPSETSMVNPVGSPVFSWPGSKAEGSVNGSMPGLLPVEASAFAFCGKDEVEPDVSVLSEGPPPLAESTSTRRPSCDSGELCERPCPHNDWDDVRTRKGVKVLRCRTCQELLKISSSRVPRCIPFLQEGSCVHGPACRMLHVHKQKINLVERHGAFGEKVLKGVPEMTWSRAKLKPQEDEGFASPPRPDDLPSPPSTEPRTPATRHRTRRGGRRRAKASQQGSSGLTEDCTEDDKHGAVAPYTAFDTAQQRGEVQEYSDPVRAPTQQLGEQPWTMRIGPAHQHYVHSFSFPPSAVPQSSIVVPTPTQCAWGSP